MNANEQWAAIGNAIWETIKWLISFGGQIEIAKEHPIFAIFGLVTTIFLIIGLIIKLFDHNKL